jgi:hypothetical protein
VLRRRRASLLSRKTIILRLLAALAGVYCIRNMICVLNCVTIETVFQLGVDKLIFLLNRKRPCIAIGKKNINIFVGFVIRDDFTRWAVCWPLSPYHKIEKLQVGSLLILHPFLRGVRIASTSYDNVSQFWQLAARENLLFPSIRGSCREFMLACHNRINLRIVNQYSDFIFSLPLFLGVEVT